MKLKTTLSLKQIRVAQLLLLFFLLFQVLLAYTNVEETWTSTIITKISCNPDTMNIWNTTLVNTCIKILEEYQKYYEEAATHAFIPAEDIPKYRPTMSTYLATPQIGLMAVQMSWLNFFWIAVAIIAIVLLERKARASGAIAVKMNH